MSRQEQRRMELAIQLAATAWCKEKTKDKTMDADLTEEFAKILVVEMYKPHLGCATSGEMLQEIKARLEVIGHLDYKTIDSVG